MYLVTTLLKFHFAVIAVYWILDLSYKDIGRSQKSPIKGRNRFKAIWCDKFFRDRLENRKRNIEILITTTNLPQANCSIGGVTAVSYL